MRRQVETEKLAVGSLLATREDELGVSVLAEATRSNVVGDEMLREAVTLYVRDMETGLRLHERERSDPPRVD